MPADEQGGSVAKTTSHHIRAAFLRREILLGAAMATTAIATHQFLPRNRIGLAPGVPLAMALPTSLGEWVSLPGGTFVMPASDEIIENGTYQDVLTRNYVRGREAVMLLVAYAPVQTQSLHIHRPEVCYPGSGFAILQNVAAKIEVDSRHDITAMFMTAARNMRTEQILYWGRIGNEFPASFMDQHFSISRQNLHGFVPDGALVRLSIITEDAKRALDILKDFARSLFDGAGQRGRMLLLGPTIAREFEPKRGKEDR